MSKLESIESTLKNLKNIKVIFKKFSLKKRSHFIKNLFKKDVSEVEETKRIIPKKV
jgi:hypothetical protein